MESTAPGLAQWFRAFAAENAHVIALISAVLGAILGTLALLQGADTVNNYITNNNYFEQAERIERGHRRAHPRTESCAARGVPHSRTDAAALATAQHAQAARLAASGRIARYP